MHVQLIDKVGLRSIGLVSDRGRLKIIYTKKKFKDYLILSLMENGY